MLLKSQIDKYAQKILDDYDEVNPSTIFKYKMKINNSDAVIIQSTVTKLREKRGEEVIGFKIGCVLKETQKKMGFTQPAWGTLWKKELYQNGVVLNKKDYSNPAMEAEFGITLNRNIDPKLLTPEYIFKSIEISILEFNIIFIIPKL